MQRKSMFGSGHDPGALTLAAALCLLAVPGPPAAAQDGRLPPALVYLAAVDSSIVQDIRYATPDNFTGAVVPGYGAAECILTRTAAEALRRVQTELATRDLSLKVYDCYRPERAVRAFVHWTREPGEQASRSPRWHPNVRRSALISLGYIAYASRHSRGDAVDLTIVRLPQPSLDPAAATRNGDCTQPAAARPADTSVDMGTGFDCLDPKSHTASPDVTSEQRHWRNTLVEAMARHGFRNYSREWWHFTHGPGDGPSYDVPIAPR